MVVRSKFKNSVALIAAALVGGGAVVAFLAGEGRIMNSGHGEASAASDTVPTKPKQFWTCGMHPSVLKDHPGVCPICHMKLTPVKEDASDIAAGTAGGQRKIIYYWDPMLGPASISNAPGKSAMGMELVPVYEDQQSSGPTVKIDPTIVQNMGVRTAKVTRGSLEFTVRAFGMLEVPEPSIYEVNLKVNGWIDKLYADTEGMHIHKGEPLFDLYSPDLQVAEEELIGAIAAAKNVDPNAPDAVRTGAQSLIDSAKQKLSLWGFSDQDITAIAGASKAPRTVPFRSPADGDLIEKMVVQGSAVQSGMKLMRIEDHSKLWLNAQVYEEQIPMVSLGQQVEATVDAVPGRTFMGPIVFIHPHVDHMTRTITVRVLVDNPRHELHPGMYATANIITKPAADTVLVPREAVIDTGTRQIVFVAEPMGHFDPRKVRMGIEGDHDQVEILEGLVPGETVVTSGQFLMDVESRTVEAVDKLRHPSPAGDEMLGPSTMPMDAMGSSGTLMPATIPAAATNMLVVAHCPMKNADWLQLGIDIANPYFGSSMPSCGTVTKTLPFPREGTSLAAVVQSYLIVAKAFDADKLDIPALQTLEDSTDKIADAHYSSLRRIVGELANTKDLDAARSSFQSVSAELTRLLENPSR